MASDDSLPTLKILLIGPSSAGKSALLMRYCEDVFEPESATATIGIDFKIKKLSVRGKAYRLTLFDTVSSDCAALRHRTRPRTSLHGQQPDKACSGRDAQLLTLNPSTKKAGQERFRTLSTSYYRGAHGVILVYDASSRTSFASMERWFDEVEVNTVPGVALYLVGAKVDKPRAVSAAEGQALADAHGANFCEVSAKTRENVRKPFVEIVDAVVSHPDVMRAADGGSKGTVNVGEDEAASSCSC